MKITQVTVSKRAAKDLRKVPVQVRNAFAYWVGLIAEHGLLEVRKIRGFHDEPIEYGAHAGERSVKMGKGWRLFYVLRADGTAQIVEVVEVNKHVYDR